MTTVPVIRLSTVTPAELTEQLGAALTECGPGFAILRDHGIPKSLFRQVQRVSRELFAHSDEHLRQYEQPPQRRVGYGPLGCETAKGSKVPDLKRFWHVRRPWPTTAPLNVWPDEESHDFRQMASALFEALDRLAFRVADALDPALGFGQCTLKGMMRGGASLLRFLHYPELTGREQAGALRSEAHEDINFFTLLVAATASGLELRDQISGEWFPVNEDPDDIVLNSCDMAKMLTQHLPPHQRLRSTTHRVVNATQGERFSWPFFIHPRGDVILDERTGYIADQYLDERLNTIFTSPYEE